MAVSLTKLSVNLLKKIVAYIGETGKPNHPTHQQLVVILFLLKKIRSKAIGTWAMSNAMLVIKKATKAGSALTEGEKSILISAICVLMNEMSKKTHS